MIDINQLTKKDIGRNVIYTPKHGQKEVGYITTWNVSYIFVFYPSKGCSNATYARDLEFEFPEYETIKESAANDSKTTT